MIAEPPKTRKHRTPAQTAAIRNKITASVHREEPLKNLAAASGLSQTHAYQMAKNMGYAQMMVSAEERLILRQMRGVAHKFKP